MGLFRIKSKTTFIAIAILLASYLIPFSYGLKIGRDISDNKWKDQIELNHKTIELEKAKNKTLSASLKELNSTNKELEELILALKQREPEVQYITKIETVIKPSDPVIVFPDIPQEYLHTLENGLTVAKFYQNENKYLFETYALSFDAYLVQGENNLSSLLTVTSSFDNQPIEVPFELTFHQITPQRSLVAPNFHLGGLLSYPLSDSGALLTAMFIHPSESVDLLGMSLAGSSSGFSFGLNPAAYRISNHIPFLEDLWINPVIGINVFKQSPNIGLSITTKL